MSAFVTFSVGSRGSAAANVAYITRESATHGEQERVWTGNVPEYVDHNRAEESAGYRERIGDLREYARQLEEDERGRPQQGKGEGRTHYRAVYSFDKEVDDKKAREMVDRHLKENFPQARYIAAIHRDTGNAHVHVQIAARQSDGKKVQLDRGAYRQLDERWAKIYGREYGPEQEREHLRKKQETREWKREAYQARREGRAVGPKPERHADRRNQVQERIRMAERQYGQDRGSRGSISRGVTRDADQRTVGGHQRPVAGREHESTTGRGSDGERVRRPQGGDREQAAGARHTNALDDARRERGGAAGHTADHRASRTAGGADGPGDRDDGASAHEGRGADRGGRRAAAEADSLSRGAEPTHPDVHNVDRASQGRDRDAARSGPADEGKLLRPDYGEVAQRVAVDSAGDGDRKLGDELRRAADDSARPAELRGEPELAHPDLRYLMFDSFLSRWYKSFVFNNGFSASGRLVENRSHKALKTKAEKRVEH